MTNLKLNDFNQLEYIKDCMQKEHNGVEFPVDFDIAWRIAGYSTKQKGKNKLKYLVSGVDFLTNRVKSSNGGRPSHLILLTCDAFKHFCLLAETKQGRDIRQYFIEAEKKFRHTLINNSKTLTRYAPNEHHTFEERLKSLSNSDLENISRIIMEHEKKYTESLKKAVHLHNLVKCEFKRRLETNSEIIDIIKRLLN